MDTKKIQQNLIRLGLLDPPADGKWGKYSEQSLVDLQEILGLNREQTLEALPKAEIPLTLGNDFASRIIKYMLQNKYFVAIGSKRYNIVYLEDIEADGKLNSGQPNHFNDRRMVIEINGKPNIIANWEATTEPGHHYTYKPMNPKGAARIAFGQYKAWRVGTHGNSEPHEALVQVSPVKVYRDANKDMIRTGDQLHEGLFGINQHWGYDLPRSNIGLASAGCLVGRTRDGHRQFMRIVKQDKRYQLDANYIFLTTIIAGDLLIPNS